MTDDYDQAARLERIRRTLWDLTDYGVDLLLRAVPRTIPEGEYGDYFDAHQDSLEEIEQAWASGDLEKFVQLHEVAWLAKALEAIRFKLFTDRNLWRDIPEEDATRFDNLLANARWRLLWHEPDEEDEGPPIAVDPRLEAFGQALDDILWGELLDYFNIHGEKRYMTEEEAAEWTALPEKLTLYIGWQRDDASEFAQIWTLIYDFAQENADKRNDGDVFMTIVDKSAAKGYINRHGRQEVILPWDEVNFNDLEPYQGPVFDSEPLES